MKYPLLLWLFLLVLLRAADTDHFVNGTLQPVPTLSTSWDFESTQNPQDGTATSTETECSDEDECIAIYLKDKRGLMTNYPTMVIHQVSKLYDVAGIGGFLVENITCILSNEVNLSCMWNALNASPDVKYSITIAQESNPTTVCDSGKKDDRVVDCHGTIESQREMITLKINVSSENFWYIHHRIFHPKEIVKLSPPQNISASVISGKLHIKWDVPLSIPVKCFRYQLKINEEKHNLTGKTSHELGVDLTKSNSVQMRVSKTETCLHNNIWSDWSTVVEVPPSEKPNELNPTVIVAIALGIPMLLLAILLVCTCHSKMEKLFPVPSPSMKAKQLLENDNFIQVLPAKSIDETTEVLFVNIDECSKVSV